MASEKETMNPQTQNSTDAKSSNPKPKLVPAKWKGVREMTLEELAAKGIKVKVDHISVGDHIVWEPGMSKEEAAARRTLAFDALLDEDSSTKKP